jgi:hypothetical protein
VAGRRTRRGHQATSVDPVPGKLRGVVGGDRRPEAVGDDIGGGLAGARGIGQQLMVRGPLAGLRVEAGDGGLERGDSLPPRRERGADRRREHRLPGARVSARDEDAA